jgi:hypothetical protein
MNASRGGLFAQTSLSDGRESDLRDCDRPPPGEIRALR